MTLAIVVLDLELTVGCDGVLQDQFELSIGVWSTCDLQEVVHHVTLRSRDLGVGRIEVGVLDHSNVEAVKVEMYVIDEKQFFLLLTFLF